jgi:hypothetical protein
MVLLGYVLLAVIVAALLFYAVLAVLPDGLSVTPQRDERPFELPADRPMERADLDRVRIPVALRGYRFAETDDLIDRLAAEIVARDDEIARLRGQDPVGSDVPDTDVAASETAAAVEPHDDEDRNAEDRNAEDRSAHARSARARPAGGHQDEGGPAGSRPEAE